MLKFGLIGLGILALIILLFMKMCGGSAPIVGKNPLDETFTIAPGESASGGFTVNAKIGYILFVTPEDGDVKIGVMKSVSKDMENLIPAEVKNAINQTSPVKKGVAGSRKGELTPGHYFWAVYNTDPKATIRAHVKFSGSVK